MDSIYINILEQNNQIIIECKGYWGINKLDTIEKRLLSALKKNSNYIIDLRELNYLDSNGAILISLFEKEANNLGSKVDYKINNPNYKRLIEIVKKSSSHKLKRKIIKRTFLYSLGEKSVSYIKDIIDFINFLGKFFIKSLALINPKNFRYKELIYFIYTSGIAAIPIISLTSFLVGVVIAYQTIVQLSKFGADIFVVDASAISIARELGPMITAIVVAGRSASSFTAEIGAMKLTQEIDAMETMGFKPFYFLVFPRVMALIISLPILIFISDIVGIFGAMVATKAQIGLSFHIFLQRLYEVLALKHYLIGLFKGPFFAIIIALVGTYGGLRVTYNTESIGLETTKSVVNAIFLVIVCDALFSVIFTRLGI